MMWKPPSASLRRGDSGTDAEQASPNLYPPAAVGRQKGYLPHPWFDADNRPVKRVKAAQRARRLEADVVDNKGKLIKAGEERRLLDVANPWMQRLIIAALETAMHRGELLKLQ